MTLTEAIQEVLAELGMDASEQTVRKLIHTRYRSLREKLDTPTFSSTLSTLRKKLTEPTENPLTTQEPLAVAPTTQEPLVVATVQHFAPRKITTAITDELTPQETAIIGFREAYKNLVEVVGSDVAQSITARLMGAK